MCSLAPCYSLSHHRLLSRNPSPSLSTLHALWKTVTVVCHPPLHCWEIALWPKAIWGGKSLWNLHFHITVHHSRESGQELTRELWGSNWSRGHGGTLFTSLLLMACSACYFIQHRSICPEVSLLVVGWSLPHQSLINKLPYRCVHRHLMEIFSHLRFSLPRRL